LKRGEKIRRKKRSGRAPIKKPNNQAGWRWKECEEH